MVTCPFLLSKAEFLYYSIQPSYITLMHNIEEFYIIYNSPHSFGAGDQSQKLMHNKYVLYHWATLPVPVSLICFLIA